MQHFKRSPYPASFIKTCLLTLVWISVFQSTYIGALAASDSSSYEKSTVVDDSTQRPPTPGNQSNETKNQQNLLCSPFGLCERCPQDALHQPYCQPFGNRRLMHCLNTTSRGLGDNIAEILAWESCGRIPAEERADFFEFVGSNLLFATLALVVLFWRERHNRRGRERILAARIGLGGGRRA